jgi:hypothetical protein
MKFSSAISNNDLLNAYSESLASAEKRLITAILEVGRDPETFEFSDIEEIEAEVVPELDLRRPHNIEELKSVKLRIETLKEKIEKLS